MVAGYNIQVTEYFDGTVVVAYYPYCVKCDFEKEGEYRRKKKLDDLRAKLEKNPYYLEENAEPEIVTNEYNPFTGQVEEMINLDYAWIYEQRHERSVRVSMARTRKKIYDYSRSADWEYFITLTYSPEKVESRYDFTGCMKKARKWVNNQQERKAPDLQYLIVPEKHKDGAWHIHGLLARTGSMEIVSSGHYTNAGEIIYNLDGWKYGFSTATKVRDLRRCSSYITKYITKDLCETTKGKRRFYNSQNLSLPRVATYIIEPDRLEDFYRTIEDTFDCELSYVKDIDGYQSVQYRYYAVKEKEEGGKE